MTGPHNNTGYCFLFALCSGDQRGALCLAPKSMAVLIKITQIRSFHLRIDRCMIGNVTFSNPLLPLKKKHDLHASYKAGVPFFPWHGYCYAKRHGVSCKQRTTEHLAGWRQIMPSNMTERRFVRTPQSIWSWNNRMSHRIPQDGMSLLLLLDHLTVQGITNKLRLNDVDSRLARSLQYIHVMRITLDV